MKSVYVILDRFRFSWVTCRSWHPNRSQEAIDEFKSGFPDVISDIEKIAVSDGRLFNVRPIEVWF